MKENKERKYTAEDMTNLLIDAAHYKYQDLMALGTADRTAQRATAIGIVVNFLTGNSFTSYNTIKDNKAKEKWTKLTKEAVEWWNNLTVKERLPIMVNYDFDEEYGKTILIMYKDKLEGKLKIIGKEEV